MWKYGWEKLLEEEENYGWKLLVLVLVGEIGYLRWWFSVERVFGCEWGGLESIFWIVEYSFMFG